MSNKLTYTMKNKIQLGGIQTLGKQQINSLIKIKGNIKESFNNPTLLTVDGVTLTKEKNQQSNTRKLLEYDKIFNKKQKT